MDKAFVTGSMAYGTPKLHGDNKSDLDLVVLVNKQDMQTILEYWEHVMLGPPPQRYADDDEDPVPSHCSLKFGLLNLIVCTDDVDFETWQKGTADLKAKKQADQPVTRDIAVAHFRRLRARAKGARLFSTGK